MKNYQKIHKNTKKYKNSENDKKLLKMRKNGQK